VLAVGEGCALVSGSADGDEDRADDETAKRSEEQHEPSHREHANHDVEADV
jgi:hypothetical protein